MKKLIYTGLSTTAVFSPNLFAETQTELDADMKLIKAYIENSDKFDFTKELNFQIKLAKSTYKKQKDALTKIDIMLAFSKKRNTSARKALTDFGMTDPKSEDILYFFMEKAQDAKDKKSLAIAGKLFFESSFKEKLNKEHPYYDILSEAAYSYNFELTKNDKNKSKSFEAWWKAKGLPPIAPPGQSPSETLFTQTYVILDNALDIFTKRKTGEINRAEITTQIKLIKDLEFQQSNDEIDPWFLLCVSEAARGMALLGDDQEALTWLGHYYTKFSDVDKAVKANAKKVNKPELVNTSIMSNFLYAKACIYWAKAQRAASSGNNSQAQTNLVDKGTKNAAVNMYLLVMRYPQSRGAIKTIFEYDDVWKLYAKVGGTKAKKDLPTDKKLIFMAHYSKKNYEKALGIADDYIKSQKDMNNKGEVLWLGFYAATQIDNFKKAEEYYKILQDEFSSNSALRAAYLDKATAWRKSFYKDRANEIKNDASKKAAYAILSSIKLSDPNNPTDALYAIVDDVKYAFSTYNKDRKAGKIKAKEVLILIDAYIKKFPNVSQVTMAYSLRGKIAEISQDYDVALASYKEFLKRESGIDTKGKYKKAEAYYHMAYNLLKLNKIEGADGMLAAVETYKTFVAKNDLSDASDKQIKTLQDFNAGLDIWKIDIDYKKLSELKSAFNESSKKLAASPDDATLMQAHKQQLEKLQKMSTKVAESYINWTKKNSKSSQIPSTLAKVGGIYQDAKMDRESQKIFTEIAEKYPDSPVLSQIQMRLVISYINNKQIGAAAKEAAKLDFTKMPVSTLQYIVSKFLYPSKPDTRKLSENDFEKATQIVIKASNQIIKNTDKEETKHRYAFYAGRAHFLIDEKLEAGKLFDIIKNEAPNSPYSLEISFLDVEIMIEKGKYTEADKIIANLENLVKSYGTQLQHAKVRTLSGKVGYGAKQQNFVLKGKTQCFLVYISQFPPDVEEVESKEIMEHATFYLIMCKVLLGEDIKKLRTEFLQKYPSSSFRTQVLTPPPAL
ncbi:hypothetical protein PQO03_07010 [Lentisphaera profundi]|uniref:Tetratricopeptide repeat protein n=1 Tax=Lentisphaera profundi TaxID=1658616 RepID=A0ABY7VN12_9BACT|nr:hypothetical protein [Lentisphaera profundi]WDE95466.1 hypothetical protein PQO03_07010 [Lentisphaera profundi]